jgi:serine/threonine protein kinase
MAKAPFFRIVVLRFFRAAFGYARAVWLSASVPLRDMSAEENFEELPASAAADIDNGSMNDSGDSGSEEETASDYKKGGYHRVHIGEVFNSRYVAVEKLGWGHFSTVWRVWDTVDRTYYAMKVQRSASHYRDAALDEIKLCAQADQVPDDFARENVLRLVNSFQHDGPNGLHVCMLFEVLGCNLLAMVKATNYKGLPLPLVKRIIRDAIVGIDFLHSRCSIIHTDFKLENMMYVRRDVERLPPPDPSLLTEVKLSKNQKKRLKKKQASQAAAASALGGDALEKSETSQSESSQAREDDDLFDASAPSIPLPALPESHGEASPSETVSEEPPPLPPASRIYWKPLAPHLQRRQRRDEIRTILNGGPEVWDHYNFKVVDLGNACWIHKHFTDDVQTRQYRSPEVILGAPWGPKIDVWSIGCIAWELLTGDFLFDPKTSANKGYDKDDDHLALIMERCGSIPHTLIDQGRLRSKYFDSRYNLRKIRQSDLRPEKLSDRIVRKYHWKRQHADELESFLRECLQVLDCDRASSAQLLEHEWLKVKPHDFSYKLEHSDSVAGHTQHVEGWSSAQLVDGPAPAADAGTVNSEESFNGM